MTLGTKKKRWQKQEQEVADKLKGKKTKQSGAGYTKGDVQTDLLFIECKKTTAKSFRVTEQLMNKLDKDSFGTHKIPCICVELGNGRMVYVLPDYAFETFVLLRAS